MRIVSWNVTRLGANVAGIRETIARLGADVLLLQEVGIRADDDAGVAALESAAPTSDHAPILVELAGPR